MEKITREERMNKMKLPVEDLAKAVGGMGNKDSEDRFYSLVGQKPGVQRSSITSGCTLEDLGADSLDVVDIVSAIEDKF